MSLPSPEKEAMAYEDDRVYVCLASEPIAKGHTIVAWKKDVSDLHLLSREDYEHLMDVVDMARSALQKLLNIEKVYLVYMDEIKHVHWHLIPRYNEQGYNVFLHEPLRTRDFSLASPLKKIIYESI